MLIVGWSQTLQNAFYCSYVHSCVLPLLTGLLVRLLAFKSSRPLMTMPRRDHENALTGTPQRRLSANHNRANSAPMVSVDRSHPVPLESSPTGRGCDQNTHEQDYRIAEADTITIDANARDDDNYNANTFQDEISDPEGKRTRNWKRILCRAVISITMVSSISFVAIDFFTNQHLKEGLGHFLDWWKQHTVAGTFAFLGLFVIASRE